MIAKQKSKRSYSSGNRTRVSKVILRVQIHPTDEKAYPSVSSKNPGEFQSGSSSVPVLSLVLVLSRFKNDPNEHRTKPEPNRDWNGTYTELKRNWTETEIFDSSFIGPPYKNCGKNCIG